jgi:hypothetical protein
MYWEETKHFFQSLSESTRLPHSCMRSAAKLPKKEIEEKINVLPIGKWSHKYKRRDVFSKNLVTFHMAFF